MIAELGVTDIAVLQKLEWARLNEAAMAVAARMNPPPGPAGPFATRRVGGGPSVDGRVIPMRPFFDGAPEISKNVPMLMGSVSEEGNSMRSRPTEAEWLATLTKSYGAEKAQALAAALQKAHPQKSIRTLSYMCSGGGLNGLGMRNNVTRMATMKHEQKAAPVFAWYFTWPSPMLEDAGAWHTAELAFCFDNTARCAQGTGNGPQAQALARKMATAWASFARTGNPSQPGLALGAVRSSSVPDHGLRRRLPHGRRSRGGGAQAPAELGAGDIECIGCWHRRWSSSLRRARSRRLARPRAAPRRPA